MLQLMIDSFVSFLTNLVVFGAVPLVWWLIFHRKKESFFRFVGLQRPRLALPVWALVVFLAVYALHYQFGDALLLPLVDDATLAAIAASENVTGNELAGLGAAGIPAAVITGLLANGFCEELLYRGFILKRFKARIGTWGAIVVTAVLFGLMHNGLMLLAGIPASLPYHIATFLFPAVGALLLGFANEKLFNGSIWPGILLHGLGNTISYLYGAFAA